MYCMKSYFLENLQNRSLIEVALNNILPGQTNPWLFKVDNDVCAYFSIEMSQAS